MKNKDDYFSENPGDSKSIDKSTQYVTEHLQTKDQRNQDDNITETGPEPKLGDEQVTDEDGHDYAG